MEGITPTLPIGGYNEGFGNNSGIWLFAILALMWGGFGGNGFGNNTRAATVEDLNNSANFTRLESQVMNNQNLIESKTDSIANGVCSLGYELQNSANNTNQIVYNQTQRILDKMAEDKEAAMTSRINQLELQQALSGVIRYPMATTYGAGVNPFFNCNCSNI